MPGSVKLGGLGKASEMEERSLELLGVYCSQLLSEWRGNFGVCFMAEIICQLKLCHYGRFVMIVRLAAQGQCSSLPNNSSILKNRFECRTKNFLEIKLI